MEQEVRHVLPADIERTSMEIIGAELARMGVTLPVETEAVVKRVIHTTADFDYVENLRFTPQAAARAVEALRAELARAKEQARSSNAAALKAAEEL